MSRLYQAAGALGIAMAVVSIAAVVSGFTTAEQQTIARLKARLSALESQAATAQANDVAMAADMDTLEANQMALQESYLAVDAGLRDLVGDGGPLYQLDRNLLALQQRVDGYHPSIALTDIAPLVSCTATECTVDVEWASDPPATGQVEWGPTTAYGNLTTLEERLLGYHKQRVGTFPADGSTYHFRVLATTPDAAGEQAGTFSAS